MEEGRLSIDRSIDVYANDTGGNWNFMTFVFVVDDTLPSIQLISPTVGSVVQSSTVVDLDILDTNLLSVVFNFDNNGNSTLYSPYDITLSVTEGTHEVNVFAVDEAGNWASMVYEFTVDDTPPIVSLNYYNNDVLSSSDTIEVEVIESNEITNFEYNWDGTNNITISSPYVVDLPSEEGEHTLNLYIEDVAGNKIGVSYQFIIDNTGPQISLIDIENNSVQDAGTSFEVQIFDENDISSIIYYWNDGNPLSKDIESDQTYAFTIPNESGTHTLQIEAVDIAGNSLSTTFTFTVETTSSDPATPEENTSEDDSGFLSYNFSFLIISLFAISAYGIRRKMDH